MCKMDGCGERADCLLTCSGVLGDFQVDRINSKFIDAR